MMTMRRVLGRLALLVCLTVAVFVDQSSGFAYDYAENGYMSDLSTDWGILGGRNHQPNCVNIPRSLTLCRDIGYSNMTLPNLLDHESLAEVVDQARVWVPLLNLHCHPDTKLFLCSLYAPLCIVPHIYPCRSLCEGVKRGCEERINNYGFPWPEILKCDKFPESGLCMKQVNFEDTANVCLACKQPLTFESLLDSYCWSQFVIKVKVRRAVVERGDMKLVLRGKKKFYKPSPNTLTKNEIKKLDLYLQDGANCDCEVANKKSGRVLVMGTRYGDRFVITYLSEWSKEREFRRAIKAIRKGHDCKKQIEEIAGQTDANNGGLRVDGKPIPPVQVPTETNETKDRKGGKGKGKGKKRGKGKGKGKKKDKNNKNDEKVDPMENIAGIGCIPCKQPLVFENLMDIYCKASFVSKVKVKNIEMDVNGDKRLVIRRMKSTDVYRHDSSVITSRDLRKLQPVISGGSSCDCTSASSKKSILVMGIKQGGRYVLTYLSEFVKDVELQRFMRAIRKSVDCSTVPKET